MLSALVVFAASAAFRVAVAIVSDNDLIERAVLAVAVVHAFGNFATDRLIDLFHLFALLALICAFRTEILRIRVDIYVFSL